MKSKLIAAACAALAVAYLVAKPLPAPPPMPADGRALAARVASRPTDWEAASALTEKALDLPVRDRLALWQASQQLASSLAPKRPEPRVAFARSGFFHWMELNEAQRKEVLEAFAPQMRDPSTFDGMAHEIYALTGDLDYLLRARPAGPAALRVIAALAATYGRFDDYRALRAQVERSGEAQPPEPPKETGPKSWSGTCGEDICRSAWREIPATRSITVALKAIETDDVAPYVELYVDGARRAEGDLAKPATFTVEVGAGQHVVEVRLVNGLTRNNVPRRIRVMSVRAV